MPSDDAAADEDLMQEIIEAARTQVDEGMINGRPAKQRFQLPRVDWRRQIEKRTSHIALFSPTNAQASSVERGGCRVR